MCTSHCPLIAVAVLAVLLGGSDRASAKELRSPFELHLRTDTAELIVHGRLDAKGKLIVDATLKGNATAKQLVLTNGPKVFTALNELEKRATSIEVVVYLRKANGKWEIEQDQHGVVGFLNNGVCCVHESENNLFGPTLGRHPTLSREAFLKNARAAVAALEHRKMLLGLPPSADRMGKIAAFWLKLDRESRYLHSHALSRALRPLSPVEEKALVALLQSSAVASKPLLLQLTGGTARGKVAFEAVADLFDRRQPVEVRQAAINALAEIDPYRAQERLSTMLRIDEAELLLVLYVLRVRGLDLPNPAVVEPLRKLTEAVRRLHRDDREAMANESRELAYLLVRYEHPKFLPLLVEWTLSDNHVTAERVGDQLQNWTGLSPREDVRRWDRWWKKVKPLLGADYDLRRAPGRREWYRAYRSGDAVTRKILLRLWAFEPAPDEAAMVREAGGEGGDVAKIVLAERWAQDRLTSATKGALVEKFLAVRLEEVPGQAIEKYRHLRVIGEKSFPFPRGVWFDGGVSIAIGDDREPVLEGSSDRSSLGEGAGSHVFGTMSGGSYPGTPKARVIVELREYVPSGSGKTGWKRTWKLGPIRLREAK